MIALPYRYAIVRFSQFAKTLRQVFKSLFLNEITLISSSESQSVNCSNNYSLTKTSLLFYCIGYPDGSISIS